MKDYIWNILVCCTQVINVVFSPVLNITSGYKPFDGMFGDPDETTSSVIGKIKMAHGGKIPRKKFVIWVIDRVICLVFPGHFLKSIEEDEGRSL